MKLKQSLLRLDWLMLAAVLILLTLGLVILFAINFKDPALAQDFSPLKQVANAVIGAGLLLILARTDYRLWQRLGKYWYLAGLGLLVGVLAFGTTAQGATRAINLGFLQFQPSEFIKLGLILLLATIFTKKQQPRRDLWYLGQAVILVVLPALLIAVQPDLGSALILAAIWGCMIMISQLNKRLIIGCLMAVLALMPVTYSFLQPYQKQRIQTFFNPQADPRGAGYNVVQSTIAVGSGGLLGKGLGSGTQSQLNFLPSQHTDFIFAVLAEKLGFLGAGLAIALYTFLILRILAIGLKAADSFGLAICVGVASLFLAHVLINIGMNLGIMPVTGIPLPLLSYGGSNLLTVLMAMGLVLSVRSFNHKLEFKS